MNHFRLKTVLDKIRRREKTSPPFFLAAVIVVAVIVSPALFPWPANRETPVPRLARSYSATPLDCDYSENSGSRISFGFKGSEPSWNATPEYSLQEDRENAKTTVIFGNISSLKGEFMYDQVVKNPLVGAIDYRRENNDLVITVERKQYYAPAKIEINGTTAAIILPPGNKNYPRVFDQKPADDSAPFPAWRLISFHVATQSPLENISVFFQGKPVDISATAIAPNQYYIEFGQSLEKDKEYAVKTIVTDAQNQTSVSAWSFAPQIPVEAVLGKDRFRNLGWWGRINADGIAVRSDPSRKNEKLGVLSSANRVKVLKEVYGQWVNDNNLWYQIDGGMYPGGYVFSDYVTPVVQPAAPETFTIPAEVTSGQKWIDVDLAKKILTLFDYDQPVFSTYISPGRDENPTRTGTFRVWYKLFKAEMRGGPPLHRYRYDLKNIPWVMYYNYDYAIHGTYWHDKFGAPQSAGCTNMTQGDAKFIFENTLPVIPEGRQGVFAGDANPGTVVFNHE